MPDQEAQFNQLLDYLKRTRGFDFTSYKPTSLTRRIHKRMETLGIDTFAAYQDYLEVHPDEFAHLFNTILINVTSFFRDESAWQYLAEEILPRLIAEKGGPEGREPIRVWSAGCASGEEAYTVAMELAELLGTERLRSRAKIHATDASDAALNKARQGSYAPKEVEGIPERMLAKYFRQNGDAYTFEPELRRCVVFGRHDLIQDSPISKIDLLICRNTLMYFNAESQARILARFAFAIAPGGYLFLGKAEMLLSSGHLFSPVDLRRRVFVKTNAEGDGRPGAGGASLAALPAIDREEQPPADVGSALVEAAVQGGTAAVILLTSEGTLSRANEHARTLFALTERDLGRGLGELTLSYRPVEIRSLIERATNERRAVHVRDVEWPVPGAATRFFDVSVSPLVDARGAVLGAMVSYADATDRRRLRDELAQCQQERETANEELQTTNEELQSTIEELETTNEELQSTNEELETMNEELQSTNEELRTANEELRLRSDDLDRVSGFWRAVLGSLRTAMVVVDSDLRVEAWSRKAEDLWGLRADEVMGKHLLNLDIGLPVDQLKSPVRAAMMGEREVLSVVLGARNRKGQPITCRVTCCPKLGDDESARGAILLIEEVALDSKAG